MAACLIPLVYLILVLVFLSQKGNGIRAAILKTALALMLGIVVATECLSRIESITFLSLTVVWLTAGLAAAGLLAYQLLRRRGWRRLKRKILRLRGLRRQPPLTGRAVVFATITGLVIMFTALVAARQYPYDNDSLCYHMSRVANWINQGNVEFYPTINQRQNFYAPGAAYLMLHAQLLSGTDKCSVLPQYAGMLLSLMLVAMLVSRLGLGRAEQWLCVALAGTIPILIGQSHCNQNELILSALLLAFIWFLVRFAEKPDWGGAIWCGCAFGLALYTKGTAFFYCAAIGLPLGIFALFQALQSRKTIIKTGLQLTVAAMLGLAIFTPFLTRCWRDGKTYFNNEFSMEVRNSRLGWDILKANVVRNAAVHLGLTDERWNTRIENWVREVVGDQAGNIESTFRAWPFKMHPVISCFYSTNPLHLALVLLSWLLIPFVKDDKRSLLAVYFSISLLAALFFNLCLKWQYWGIRLQLPWLLLSIPLIGIVLTRTRLPKPVLHCVQVAIVLALFAGAIPALILDNDLPLVHKDKAPLMFRDAQSIRFGAREARFADKNTYSKVVSFIKSHDPDDVGLLLPRGNSCLDYQWWVAFGTHARPGRPRLRHVGPGAWPAPAEPPPEWIIVRSRTRGPVALGHFSYEKAFQSGGCRVYHRADMAIKYEARQ